MPPSAQFGRLLLQPEVTSGAVWSEPILHVDMDSFFVEVERLGDPSLVGRPVAVGGTGPRGVIASASYEARRFGVHSAQPTASALRMCPDLIIVPPAHGRYSEISAQVFVIFRSFTPLVEGLSLDEAFLDATGLRHHYASSTEVGQAIRKSLRTELLLPASVGVASTKFIAKLASDEAKPDGLLHVAKDTQLEFLHELPASSLWGSGRPLSPVSSDWEWRPLVTLPKCPSRLWRLHSAHPQDGISMISPTGSTHDG